ncbi:MAG TPA: redoxin domain-containing protein [Anditalea sp.]|nr:redoxin domain-containing protein [Anditalea sp.]
MTKIIKNFLVLLVIGAFSCGNETTESSHEENGFVPNPQEMDEQPVGKLQIGDDAPPFRLPDVSGRFYSLTDFDDSEVLVINFTCNHCPTAQAYEDRYIALVEEYENQSVQFIGISPNSPIAVLPEELGYSDLNDDFESMKLRYKDKGYNFPYLYDGDDHEFSLAYGPTATPHVFVFDKERKLTYAGRIDANEKPGTGNSEDLRSAIDNTLIGESVTQGITPAFGCSTKWAWKNEFNKKVEKEWQEKPVSVDKVSIEQLQDIMRNDSEELLLVNFWATWCGPCVIEYPEFIEMQRMYGERDFRFISVSMDDPSQEEKVLKFLKNKYSAVPNYLIDTDDKYAVIDLVDQEWDGSLPITLLIEPQGNVAYKRLGTIDVYELRKTIVDHPMIGRYY